MPFLEKPPPSVEKKAFYILALEMNQAIASNLDDDVDIVHFRATCRATKDAIDAEDSFWFKRFNRVYDPTLSLSKGSKAYKVELRSLYQMRYELLACYAFKFKRGNTALEKAVLDVVVGMIVDSFQGKPFVEREGHQSQLTCNNLLILRRFVSDGYNNLLDAVFCPVKSSSKRINPTLAAVQVTFTAWCIRKSFRFATYGFDYSQQIAYATADREPIFTGFQKQTVNLPWLLHVMNFFKYHITDEDNATLSEPFSALSESELPTLWHSPLHNGPSELGKYWKGTYAYIERDEIKVLRDSTLSEDAFVFVDHNVDHGSDAIQTMAITFPKEPDFPWPDVFERHLKSLTKPSPPRTRAQHSDGGCVYDEPINTRFQASGWDNEDFSAAGWLGTLPSQQGIPGWKRMTMMKYFEDDTGGWDEHALWAYEGVVLPGGQIIIGRWWSPEDDTHPDDIYTGPFIFWNVDASKEDTKLHSMLRRAPRMD